jgi:hypothetical protein
MIHNAIRGVGLAGVGLLLLAASVAPAAEPAASLKKGTPDLKSAGPLAFGPEGILFVGDTQGAALFAIETGEPAKSEAARPKVAVKEFDAKIAALLGTQPKQILINDLAVNPATGSIYLSVSRGRGPDAQPALIRLLGDGRLEEVSLENVRFARADLPNPPDADAKSRGQSLRNESITDLAYVDGRLFVAGLSNEEFSSRLIAIPFPFTDEIDGAAIEIYHGAHGRFETKSPVRTFVPYQIDGKSYLLAAYTCTPLVKVPVADLKAGAHVRGTTIAELGNRNRPLDMIPYEKDGGRFLLLANSSRGVMKIATEGARDAQSISQPVPDGHTKGLGYDTIDGLKGVVQMDKLGDRHAIILTESNAGLSLETIDLP